MRENAAKIKEQHTTYYEALEFDSGVIEDRYGTMQRIQWYINSCYFLAINPLPQLRQAFPQYEWQFHSLTRKESIQKVVARSDFIWDASCWDFLDPNRIELVTATKSGQRTPFRMFFVDEEQIKTKTPREKFEFATSCGGDPVYSEEVADR